MDDSRNEMMYDPDQSFGDVIRTYRRKKNMTQEELGSLVHVKKNAVGAWEAGRSRPDLASAPVLCETLGIPLHVFFGLPSSVIRTPFQVQFDRLSPYHQTIVMREMDMLYAIQSEKEKKASGKTVRLFLNDLSAAAGPVSYLGDNGGHFISIYEDDIALRADEIIRVSGDSMEPSFSDGDKVFVQHDTRLREGEIGIFVNGDSGFIKEYHKDGLYSHNPKYPPMRFSEDDSVRCIGRVLGILRPEQIAPEVG